MDRSLILYLFFSGVNFVPSFLFIASGIMLMHYDYCQTHFQQCPAPIAVGPKGTGKTTAAKAFLSLVGHEKKNLARKLTEVEAAEHCSRSSFPYVYDDPDNVAEVKRLLNNNFNGQVRATTRATSVPRTSCMFAMNTARLTSLIKDFQ